MDDLRDYQTQAINELRMSLSKGKRRPVVQMPTGAGKCLGIGTPVLLYDGRIVPIESIAVGDLLMGPDSQPKLVLSTCRGTGELFQIIPTKGEPWVCNDVHVLTLVETESGRVVDIALDKYLSKSKTFKHCHKLFAPNGGVNFKFEKDPSSIPWFLGYWIGDGTKSLTGVAVSSIDFEVLEECKRVADLYGAHVRTDGKTCPTHHIVTPRGKPNPLLDEMRELMGNGCIPHSFLTASKEFRLQFLAGILDADGHLSNGYFEICQKSVMYADAISFIARSLGFKVNKSIKTVNGTDYVRLTILGDICHIPNKLPRKQAVARRQIKNPLRTGFKVKSIGVGEYAGFELDGDGRFLLGDFTVTHNTIMAAAIVRMAREKGAKVIFCVPMISLIDQTVDRFARNGIRSVGVIQAQHELTDSDQPVQVASVQTLMRRKIPDAQVVIIDECHKQFKLYEDWFSQPEWKDVPIIGLSATPWAKGMGKVWDDLIIGTTTQDLINRGVLSDFKVFAPTHPDLTGVKTVAGDFEVKGLGKAMNKSPLVADLVSTWLERGENRPTLCFAVDRVHAKHIQKLFEEAGVKTGYVDAFSTLEERKEVQEKFASGEIKIVCNVGVLTTGVDWDVRCIILARPTKSEILYTQIIGRGLRTAPGKDHCLILDHSDSTLRLGFVTDIHYDKLDDGRKTVQAKQDKKRLPKECPKCAFLRPAGTNKCPNCGFVAEPVNKTENVDGHLYELVRGPNGKLLKRPKHTMDERQRFYSELILYANQNGYKPGWAFYSFRDRYGEDPDRKLSPVPAKDYSPSTLAWITHRNIKRAKSMYRMERAKKSNEYNLSMNRKAFERAGSE